MRTIPWNVPGLGRQVLCCSGGEDLLDSTEDLYVALLEPRRPRMCLLGADFVHGQVAQSSVNVNRQHMRSTIEHRVHAEAIFR